MNALRKLKGISEAADPQCSADAYMNYCIAARTSFPVLVELCEAQREEINAMKHLRSIERKMERAVRLGRDQDKRKAKAHTDAQQRLKAASAAVEAKRADLEGTL